MSMIPFFPSLRPSVSASLCYDVDMPCDDENELREMERDHVSYVSKFTFCLGVELVILFLDTLYSILHILPVKKHTTNGP